MPRLVSRSQATEPAVPTLTCPSCDHRFETGADEAGAAPSCARCGQPCQPPSAPETSPPTLLPAPPSTGEETAAPRGGEVDTLPPTHEDPDITQPPTAVGAGEAAAGVR